MQDPVPNITRALEIEFAGVDRLCRQIKTDESLQASLVASCDLILATRGRLVVSGVGKSGHVARKCASTFASTGTPAFFVHPTEASHGDLGMIQPDDCLFAMSWSGETGELESLLRYAEAEKVPLIGITSGENSTLSQAATISIVLPPVKEACPNGLAPTTSAIIQMMLVDALAIELLSRRNFSAVDFRRFHPGGHLGAKLRKLGDVMRQNKDLPLVPKDTSLQSALMAMSEKAAGCCGVTDDDKKLVGMVTDGDLRRYFDRPDAETSLDDSVSKLMTKDPKVASPSDWVEDVKGRMDREGINAIFVVDEGKAVGLVTLRDLLTFSQ